MKPTILKAHDTRRNEVLGLVRRQVSSGRFTKSDVDRWKKELEADVVDGIVEELAPEKATKAASSKKASSDEPAAPEPKE